MRRLIGPLSAGVVACALSATFTVPADARETVHFRENYDTGGFPSFNFDRAQTMASLDRFKKLATNLKATVVIQHDQRDIARLPAFPAAAR